MKRSPSPFSWVIALLPLAALSACVSSRDLAIGEDCDGPGARAHARRIDGSLDAGADELLRFEQVPHGVYDVS